eukprot:gene7353-7421_t
MIQSGRVTAHLDGDFVIFLIGMRINAPLKIHKWLPVTSAMPKMLKELYSNPGLGLLHHEMWFSRTIMMVQYWRSIDQLMDYASNKNNEHLPAWRAFNQSAKGNQAVGIWHETYAVAQGNYENIYVNMPAFGLGKAGRLEQVTGAKNAARGRLGK